MKVVYSLSDAALETPCVLSIGNFDGVHLGHRSILQTVVRRARELGIRPAIMTFDPHPIRVLAPGKAPKLIATPEQKLRWIGETGIETVFMARFDSEFSKLSPDAFIEQYLIHGLHARAICVGGNFTFGHRQTGNIGMLKERPGAFEVIEIPEVTVRGTTASSTNVRQMLADGQVSRACRLLGRWYEVEGPLVSGAGRGRNVTVPTLNLEPENELLPRAGVYVSRIAIDGGDFMEAVTNIGVSPTFGENKLTVETFVLHDSVPVKAPTARLQFLRRIRDERRFDSPELLRQQIGRDVRTASTFFRILMAAGNARTHSR